jgi:hypothetical protein
MKGASPPPEIMAPIIMPMPPISPIIDAISIGVVPQKIC